MSDSPQFYLSSSSTSQSSTPQAGVHTCEPCGTSCQQMAESQTKKVRDVCLTQQQSNTFSSRTAVVNRRNSADSRMTIVPASGSASALARSGPIDSDRFHPYRRQFSDGAVTSAGCVQLCSSSFSSLQDVSSPDTCSHSSGGEAPTSWDEYNSSIQSSYPEPPAAPGEPSCFLSQSFLSYSSLSSRQQVSSRLYSEAEQCNGSKYSLQSLSTPSQQENNTHSLFPKPIYSYSILIFMALKNSKIGSLPVSEIYSFMTEHFPYFKTAPDGWKNSVRHNLSLNKCFVKVENKNGNSSRKGCLWALNPAKVEKMQEELHKWRRKDPVTVRRSMARPEDFDRLLGERPDRFRSLPPYTSAAHLSRVAPVYSPASSSCPLAHIPPTCLPTRRPQFANIQPQHPSYPPPVSAAHPSNSYTLYSPPGSLHSPVAGKMPPVYSSALQPEFGVGPRSMQEFLLEGDPSYDIDMLNPSLTDLQLQGNMWEELREDGLVSDPQVTTTTPSTAVCPPLSEASDLNTACRRKAECEDGHGHLSALLPVGYSGMESLAGYLTSSCTKSISLM